MNKSYRIGEIAKATGTSVETLRYYEREGLLPDTRRSGKGYRLYNSESLARVQFILRAKRLGFSLRDIGELLNLRSHRDSATCGEVKSLADAKLEQINEKIAQLSAIKSALQTVSDRCCGGEESAAHCTILSALDDQTSYAQAV